jgi:nicotinate-nucleotide adenylyltransferase
MSTTCTSWIRPPAPVAAGLRVGLLGGSFNPAHEGHLHVSEIALKRLGLDYLWWLVSPQNPLKPVEGMAALGDRVAGALQMARRNPRIRVTAIEACLGTRFTVDTVARLKRRFPQLSFVWLMGSDNLVTFHRWHKWEELARSIPVAVIVRPGTALAPRKAKAAQRFAAARLRDERLIGGTTPPALAIVEARRDSASATAIRAQVLAPATCVC